MLYTALAVFIMAGGVFLVGTVLGVAIALGVNHGRARAAEGNLAISVHPLKRAAAVNASLPAEPRSTVPLAA